MYFNNNLVLLKGVFLSDCGDKEIDIFSDEIVDDVEKIEHIVEDKESVSISELLREEKIYTKDSIEDEYIKLPPIFVNTDTWPVNTNLRCWFCHLSFVEIPISIPLSLDRNIIEHQTHIEEQLQFKMHGCFCGFNCSAAYIDNVYDYLLQNSTSSKKSELKSLLYILYDKIYGKKIDFIPPSPYPSIMTKYGGDKGEEEYRSIVKDLTNNYIKALYESSVNRSRVS